MESRALIELFLDRVRRLRSQTQVLHGIYIIFTYLTATYLIACLFAWAFQSTTTWTWPALGIIFLGLIYITYNYIFKALLTPFSRDDAAILVDSFYPNLKNALISSSQLGRQLNNPRFKNDASLEFIQELHRRTDAIVNKINPSTVVNQKKINSSRNYFLGFLITLIFITFFFPDFIRRGHERLANPKISTQPLQLQTKNTSQKEPKSAVVNYSVESLDLTFNFPAYTKIRSRSIKTSDGKIHVLPGTEVNLSAKINIPVLGADLVLNGKDNFSMNKESPTDLETNLFIKEKGFYQFNVKDQNRNKHLLAKKYPITIYKDLSPNIILFLANPKPVYFNTDKVQFFYEGNDDFGIISVELMVFVNGKTKVIPIKKYKNQQKEVKSSYTWNLAQLALNPGENVQYYLQIKDNDNVFGPNKGQSEAYSFTMFDSRKELENLIAMQEQMTEQMIALLATGLVKSVTLKNQPGNLLGWKKLFTASVDDLIAIVRLAQRIHDRGKLIQQFPQAYINLLKNITEGLSRIRRAQIETLSEIEGIIYKPTQAKFEVNPKYDSLNNQMTEHLEKDILFLIKMTNEQKLDRIIGLEEELNQLAQSLREEFEKIENDKSPKNTNELKNKIKKIRETLQKIMNQLANQTQAMPDEFLNPGAFKRLNMEKFSATLDKMKNMINQGKIEEAMKQLKQMTEDLQHLANQLNRANSEMSDLISPETMKILNDTNKKLDQLKNIQQKIIKETTKINQAVKQQQSKQFENQLNKLFASLLHNVDAIQKLIRGDEKLLKEHAAMKQFEKLKDEEYEVNQKIKELSQSTVNSNQLEKLNQSFHKLNIERKEQSRLDKEKNSLGVNEFQKLKEALPQLIKKYDTLNELAQLKYLQEFANQFKQTYPEVLRWQNNLQTAPNLLEDLSVHLNKDMKQITQLNNEISKKLGSMMHSIRKKFNSAISEDQKKELNQMADQENSMREKTNELSKLLEKLNKENPVIPPELSRSMDQTSLHIQRAEKNLRKQNIQESIQSENQALKGLNNTRDMLSQMKNSNGKMGKSQNQTSRKLGTGNSPDSRRGGAQRMQKERVLLPSEDQYQAPKEFREEILNAMKRKTPKNYQSMVIEYYKNLVK